MRPGSLISLNVRGLAVQNMSKIKYIEFMIKNENAYLVSISESWLEEGILDAELKIPGFTVYRSDRKLRNRGGVCVYIRSDISTAPSLRFSNGVVDMLVMKTASIDSILIV